MSEEFSNSSSDEQFDLRYSIPSLSGSQNKSQNLISSTKLSSISSYVQAEKIGKFSRIHKKLSLGNESDGNNKETPEEILEKFSNESLYREKLKILLSKNEDFSSSGTSSNNKKEHKDKKHTTLKSIRRVEKYNARKTLLETVEALEKLNEVQII